MKLEKAGEDPRVLRDLLELRDLQEPEAASRWCS